MKQKIIFSLFLFCFWKEFYIPGAQSSIYLSAVETRGEFRNFYNSNRISSELRQPLADLPALLLGLANYRKACARALSREGDIFDFFLIQRSTDKAPFLRKPFLGKMPMTGYSEALGATIFYANEQNVLSLYGFSKEKLLGSLNRLPGNQLLEYRFSAIQSEKNKEIDGFHVQSETHLSTGKISLRDILLALEAFYLMSENIAARCNQEAGSGPMLSKKNPESCFWKNLAKDYPQFAAFLRKNFIIRGIGDFIANPVGAKNENFYKFHLSLALSLNAWKAGFPIAWERNAYSFKNLEYRILFRDYRGKLLGGFEYNRTSRTWNLWFKIQKRRIFPFYEKSGSFIPSELKRQRFYWDIDGRFNLYGLKISWKKLRLSVDYNHSYSRCSVIFRWMRSPVIETSGRFVGVIPPWLLDALIPSSMEQIFNEYVRTLAGQQFPKGQPWTLKLESSRLSRDKNLLSILVKFDTHTNKIFRFLMKNQRNRLKTDQPSFSQVFFQSLYQDAKN
jgi:hypothetical protein